LAANVTNWGILRLPTLCECSYNKDATHNWSAGGTLPGYGTPTLLTGFTAGQFDAWRNPLPYQEFDQATGANNTFYTPGAPTTGQRVADDVILTNVIGFDVKAWDPVAGMYVDLGTGSGTFSSAMNKQVGKDTSGNAVNLTGVYDTWSTHYESETVSGLGGTPGQAMDGFDTPINGSTNGIVDDAAELRTSPPYPVPLRGIQVKIRVFEPDSRQVREVTVVQDFLPQ
jgi:hypothetical protein